MKIVINTEQFNYDNNLNEEEEINDDLIFNEFEIESNYSNVYNSNHNNNNYSYGEFIFNLKTKTGKNCSFSLGDYNLKIKYD